MLTARVGLDRHRAFSVQQITIQSLELGLCWGARLAAPGQEIAQFVLQVIFKTRQRKMLAFNVLLAISQIL